MSCMHFWRVVPQVDIHAQQVQIQIHHGKILRIICHFTSYRLSTLSRTLENPFSPFPYNTQPPSWRAHESKPPSTILQSTILQPTILVSLNMILFHKVGRKAFNASAQEPWSTNLTAIVGTQTSSATSMNSTLSITPLTPERYAFCSNVLPWTAFIYCHGAERLSHDAARGYLITYTKPLYFVFRITILFTNTLIFTS